MKLKRALFIGGSGVFVGCAVFCAFQPSPKVTLTLIGYTNDVRSIRQYQYRLPDTSDRSMAVFQITNRTKQAYFYYDGPLEIRLPNGWTRDTNYICQECYTFTPRFGGFGTDTLLVPTPSGSHSWRYSIHLNELSPNIGWRSKVNGMLERIGIGRRRNGFTVTSAEIQR